MVLTGVLTNLYAQNLPESLKSGLARVGPALTRKHLFGGDRSCDMSSRTALAATLMIAVMVATAGCSGVFTNSPNSDNGGTAEAQQSTKVSGDDSGRTIQVVATGQAATSPDQALVRVSVVATNSDPAAAVQTVANKSSMLQNGLSTININDSQIQTTRYNIYNQEERNGGGGNDQYQATHSFQITVDDPNQTGNVIDTAVTNGAARIDHVQFTVTEATQEKLQSTAIENAMSNARTQAETIATQSNLSITGVESVQTGTLDGRERRIETEAALAGGAGDAGGVPTSVDGGQITVPVRLSITYNASAQ